MADTTVPVLATNIITTSISSAGVVVFGMHTGLDYPTLLAGILGGAFALSYSEKTGLVSRAFEVFSASLLAGYSSPVLAKVGLHLLTKYDFIVDADEVRVPSQAGIALMIGYLAHGGIFPGIRKLWDTLIRRTANE